MRCSWCLTPIGGHQTAQAVHFAGDTYHRPCFRLLEAPLALACELVYTQAICFKQALARVMRTQGEGSS